MLRPHKVTLLALSRRGSVSSASALLMVDVLRGATLATTLGSCLPASWLVPSPMTLTSRLIVKLLMTELLPTILSTLALTRGLIVKLLVVALPATLSAPALTRGLIVKLLLVMVLLPTILIVRTLTRGLIVKLARMLLPTLLIVAALVSLPGVWLLATPVVALSSSGVLRGSGRPRLIPWMGLMSAHLLTKPIPTTLHPHAVSSLRSLPLTRPGLFGGRARRSVALRVLVAKWLPKRRL